MTVVVGTAGHIDHGKTTLLRALTGIDADRLPEIDLARASGRHRCRSAPAAASSCRGRCGPRSRRRRSCRVPRRTRRGPAARGLGRGRGQGPRRRTDRTVRRSRTRAPCSRRPTTRIAPPEARRERRRTMTATTRPTDSSISPGNDPPPTADIVSETTMRERASAGSASNTASARRPSDSVVAAIICQTGISASPGRPDKPERRLERGEGDLVASHGTGQRVAGMRPMNSARPTISPACGPPKACRR